MIRRSDLDTNTRPIPPETAAILDQAAGMLQTADPAKPPPHFADLGDPAAIVADAQRANTWAPPDLVDHPTPPIGGQAKIRRSTPEDNADTTPTTLRALTDTLGSLIDELRQAWWAGYAAAITELRAVAQRSGSPAATWAADYLDTPSIRRYVETDPTSSPEPDDNAS